MAIITQNTTDAAAVTSLTQGSRYVWRVGMRQADGNLSYSDWSDPFAAASPVGGVQAGSDLNIGTGKILYSNVYPTLADLPDAANYHGMFAHVHAEEAAYYAHAGNWVRLADKSDIPTAFVSGLNGLTGPVVLAGGSNVQIGQSGNQLTISSTQTFTTLNGESGTLSLVGEGGISVAAVDGTITVSGAGLATEGFVNQAVADLVNSAPQTLDTLAELANALNNDSDFAANVTTLISQKTDTSVNTLTGNVTLVGGDNINVTTSGQNVVISGQGGGITWATEPAASNSTGNAGDIAYGSGFFYLHDGTEWRRAALSTFCVSTPTITITTQPQDLTLADGGSGNFTIAATVSDGSTPSYQWQNSDDSGATWDTLTGSTGTTYSLSGVSTLDNGTQYRAIVSASGASDVTSSVATLTVTAAAATYDLLAENGDRLMTEAGDSLDHDGDGATLTITSQPQNTTAAGGEASFAVSATVSDGSALTYQWEEERLVEGGETWVQRTLPVSAGWQGVAYGNGTFVATAYDSNIAATSTDGINWTQRTLPASASWRGVTYGDGTFVAVGDTNIAATSPDGINWTQQTLPTTISWNGVTHGNGTFVAVAYDSNIAATSTDGITWTQRTLPASEYWYSVTYGDGTFVAVTYNSNIAATSPDGITWTQRTLPATANWYGVTHGDGTFVAVAYDSNIAATSTDGITWTQRTLPASAFWRGVTYGDGTFVAVGGTNIAATSPDGITWTQRTLPATASWYTVTHGNGTFVAVPSGGNIAATSTSTLQFLPLSGETSSTLNLTGLTTADDGERYRVVVDSPSVEPVTSDTAVLTVSTVSSWTQYGSDIDGGAAGSDLGPVALNSNGTVMVVGEPGHDGGGLTNNGLVTVYADNGTAWVQRGLAFAGAFNNSYRGQRVDISSDGNAVVLSEYNQTAGGTTYGWARRFVYDGTSWTQSPAGTQSPNAIENQQDIAISGDGNFVAAVYQNRFINTGGFTVWDVSGGTWDYTSSGEQTLSNTVSYSSIRSIALSHDGSIVAVGDTGFNTVTVQEFTGTVYARRGSDPNAPGGTYASLLGSPGDYFGQSVSLTSNGNRIAVGAPYGDAGGTDRGYVRIYDWNGSAWSQVGGDITGVNNYDYAGWSVDISSDGSRVVVGLRGADGNGSNSGTTRIYDYNGTAWVQVGGDIEGAAGNDYSGSFVTISGDGTRVGIGAPGNDDGGADAGQVRVFEAS